MAMKPTSCVKLNVSFYSNFCNQVLKENLYLLKKNCQVVKLTSLCILQFFEINVYLKK